jgi:hypothetical protein
MRAQRDSDAAMRRELLRKAYLPRAFENDGGSQKSGTADDVGSAGERDSNTLARRDEAGRKVRSCPC